MEIKFFKTPEQLRRWISNNYNIEDELWIGFYKKATGKQSITWPEAVDEALCFGWIDGIRKRIDDISYKIRFTPRRQNSNWSTVNIERVKVLSKEGRMHTAGIEKYQNRNTKKDSRYSFEQKNVKLDPKYEKILKQNEKAWDYFKKQAPYYKRTVTWWIMSAKRDSTRLRRLNKLIESSEQGKRPGEFTLQEKENDKNI